MDATREDELKHLLTANGQEHLLRAAAAWSSEQRRSFFEQLASLDLRRLPEWRQAALAPAASSEHLQALEPAPFYGRGDDWDRARFYQLGVEALAAGQIGAFVVAGGQGTRLGFPGPKGTLPVTALGRRTLFQVFAETLLAASRRFGHPIPWYVMTSPANHSTTLAHFERHRFFGLKPDDVFLFPQGMLPAFEPETGRMLLEKPGALALRPDGHGGSLAALARSGALSHMRERGVRHLSYFQVDNPLVCFIDPVFFGLHLAASDSSAEMTSKCIPKRSPDERVGVFARDGGRLKVVEYVDLPAELAAQTTPSGRLRFEAGSPAIHMISRDFVEAVGKDLPLHRARKPLTYLHPDTGEPVEQPVTVLETFVFDALPSAKSSVIMEMDRAEEFAPIKNATGEDSLVSSRLLQTARAARWLEAVGVSVPRTGSGEPACTLEITPLGALFPEDLRALELPEALEAGHNYLLSGGFFLEV